MSDITHNMSPINCEWAFRFKAPDGTNDIQFKIVGFSVDTSTDTHKCEFKFKTRQVFTDNNGVVYPALGGTEIMNTFIHDGRITDYKWGENNTVLKGSNINTAGVNFIAVIQSIYDAGALTAKKALYFDGGNNNPVIADVMETIYQNQE